MRTALLSHVRSSATLSCKIRGAFWLPFFCFSGLLLLRLLAQISAANALDTSNTLKEDARAKSAIEVAREINLANDGVWRALLHVSRGRCLVTDPTFRAGQALCDPSEELVALLNTLILGDKNQQLELACRFPARIAFLQSSLRPYGIVLPEVACPEVIEFQKRAPAEEIILAFAAENITHPMSIMGHVFIVLRGKGQAQQEVSHAVSFFTSLESQNPISLAADALFLGMPSYFALTPYREQLDNYRRREMRNIWEYKLRLSDRHRKLIQLHLWELRSIKTPYLFTGYNCATVVYLTMAIAAPELLDSLNSWIAPIDVIRRAYSANIIDSRAFLPSVDWQIRNYAKALGSQDSALIKDIISEQPPESWQNLLLGKNDHLRLAFAQALKEKEQDSLALDRLQLLSDSLPTAEIRVENLKDPLLGPRFPQLTLGMAHVQGHAYALLGFQPISHLLSDDNSQSSSESSLEIGRLSLLWRGNDELPIVDRFSLYSFDSLIPYDLYAGGLSTRIRLAVARQLDSNLEWFSAGTMGLGGGYTLDITEDLNVFALGNAAANYGIGRGYLSYGPELGATIYEFLRMKTTALYKIVCGEGGSSSCYQAVGATQSIFVNRSLTPYLRFEAAWNDNNSWQRYEAGMQLTTW